MFRAPTLFNRNRNAPALRDRDNADPFYSFHREMNRLFDDFLEGFAAPAAFTGDRAAGVRGIHLDVNETDKNYEIEAELPGVDEDNVNVDLTDNLLTIRGEKSYEKNEEKEGVKERAYSSFQRSISLPFDVDPDAVTAKFKNGVLKLTLPKPPEFETRKKKIEIQRG